MKCTLILVLFQYTALANVLGDSTAFQKGMACYMHLNFANAGTYFTEAAKENSAEAYTMLALMQVRGELGRVDLDLAWKLATEGLNRGDRKAYYAQGMAWQEKTGQTNSLTGNSYFVNAIPAMQQSADQGSTFWITRLGYCYNNGLGVAKDHELAFTLYRKGAEDNYASAIHNLGIMYFNGEYVAVDYEKALALFRRSLALGLISRGSLTGSEVGIYDVAYAYHNGNDHTTRDFSKALSLYMESAAKGYGPAYTGIGRLFDQNFPKAKEYLLKGIEAGDGEAATELALHYIDKDTAQSRRYYEMALKMNDNTGLPEAGLSHLYAYHKSKAQYFASIALTKGVYSEYVHIPKILVGEIAPDFELQTDKGELMKLSALRGKYVLVDFWASWCGPCRRENPNLVQVYNEYKEKGFTVLGVSLDEEQGPWLSAIRKDNLTWHQVSDLRGWRSAAGKLYNVSAIPGNFLLDKAGKIIAIDLRGPQLREKLEELEF